MSEIEKINQSVQMIEENNFYTQSKVHLSNARNSVFFHADIHRQSQTSSTPKTVAPINRNPQGEKG